MKTFGPGLQLNGTTIGKPTEFTVDTKKAGVAPLEIKVID